MTTNTGATLGMAAGYNENSSSQLAMVNYMIPYIHMGIDHLDISSSSSPLIIADFGSSHGRNSIEAMKIIIQYLQQTNKLITSPLVVHNDLPTNDWTTLFQLLAEDNSYQGMAIGRSFYEQCLPSNSLSIGFSSTSINWLSKIPCTITNHRFYTFANEKEHETFKHQSKLDFDAFIENRSRELVPGGILILNIPSTDHQGIVSTAFYCDHVYTCAKLLFNEQELSDLTIPLYCRSLSECVDHALFDRCSLQLIKAESGQVNGPFFEQLQKGQLTLDEFIKIMTKTLQCAFESSIRRALEINGRSKEEIDQLLIEFWSLYEEKLKEKSHSIVTDNPLACVCLVLKKLKVVDK
ncbi:unnamed protein product [Rotaria sordida]|uniref:Uncharacterized protein n=1 Tax=Rotaria sordida TaxID=392033 RepID=A0A814YVT3_9BILA|nr:unnamed protein product [Rotaria sordida]